MTGTPQLLLVHHLKTLKLPAFLREYASWPASAPPRAPAMCAISSASLNWN